MARAPYRRRAVRKLGIGRVFAAVAFGGPGGFD